MSTQPNNDPKAKAKKASVPGIKVVARKEQFRRAGRVFTGEAATIPLSELKKEQLEQLRSEPMLVVVDVDIPVAEEAAATGEDK